MFLQVLQVTPAGKASPVDNYINIIIIITRTRAQEPVTVHELQEHVITAAATRYCPLPPVM